MKYTIVLCCLCFILSACTTDSQTLFTKLDAKDTRIDFVNQNIETEQANILAYEYFYNGGGVAVGDLNDDGLIDIYFTSNSNENKLYLNEGDLQFRDITVNSGTACPQGWKTGVGMADVNGDGWLDIYVSRSAYKDARLRKNILYINNHDLTFTDQASQYGLDDDSFSTQASFFDYDQDGDLDAFLLNHSLLDISNSFDISLGNTKKRHPYVGNKLMRNDNGHFVDVSDSTGVYGPSSNYGLGMSLSDINNDGWLDVYAGNDYTGRDKLLLNVEGRFFQDATDSLLSHISKFTMGTDIADFNGDGLMDIYTLDMLPEDNRRQKLLLGSDRYNFFTEMVRSGLHHQYMRNMLHLNSGNGYFSEVGQLAGVANTDWSWSPLFADFDNDGILDLFISNGFKRDLTNSDFAKYHAYQKIEQARKAGQPISRIALIEQFSENKIHDYIFKGKDSLAFADKSQSWGLNELNLTNGVAYGDLDNDGDLDLVMNHLNSSAGIYRNNSETQLPGNHHLKVALHGIDKNTQAVGAKVTVYAGNKQLTRELIPVRGYQSSVDPMLHFGLGTITSIDSLVIRWPTRIQQSIRNVQVDQTLDLKRPADISSLSLSPSSTVNLPAPYFKLLAHTDDEANEIDYTHTENDFVDFDIQALLPRMYSTQGPAMCKGDSNNDGLTDVYVGGAKGQAAALFIQKKEGGFIKTNQPLLESDKQYEDIDASFFDADNDGDQDLYVVSGGYEFESNDPFLQDRLYINDGKGRYKKAPLPSLIGSKSCVRPCDFDQDGDIDLFIGGRLIPGRYPETPESYLLINNGAGLFTKEKNAEPLAHIGMVTDAVWIDINKDHFMDLIVVGEWMGIEIFINENGKLKRSTSTFIKTKTEGWWNCIVPGDFDKDGDIDFIVGNAGLNNAIKASLAKPASLFYHDFDNNGSIDPILSYFIADKNYPYASRDELIEQWPVIKKRFPDYTSYADITVDQLLNQKQQNQSKRLTMVQMQSCYLRNERGELIAEPLPIEMQIAPVFAITPLDVNHDGNLDFVAAGNLTGTRSRTGKMTGNMGFVFTGDGKGHFQFVTPLQSGIRCVGDVRHMIMDSNKLIIGVNNKPVQIYQLN